MKVAVSGATGFIGRHVVAELEKRAITPILLVRPPSIMKISHVTHSIIPFDIEQYLHTNLYEFFEKPDVLIHCAWSGLPNYKSLHHFEKETQIQYQFITNLINHGLQNIVITGTCFEYGMQCGELAEDMIAKPCNPYGFAKHALLEQLKYFQTKHFFNLTWARLFYLYGDGQSEGALFSQLKNLVTKKEKIFNMSSGEQLRDYLPVHRVAEHLVSLALLLQNDGVINICSGRPISIRKLVETWIAENNWDIQLNLGYYPYSEFEPMSFWGSCKKLSHILKLNF